MKIINDKESCREKKTVRGKLGKLKKKKTGRWKGDINGCEERRQKRSGRKDRLGKGCAKK